VGGNIDAHRRIHTEYMSFKNHSTISSSYGIQVHYHHYQRRYFDRLLYCDSRYVSKMYLGIWKPPGVSKRMWSVSLDVSISGKYQTLEVHSCHPSE